MQVRAPLLLFTSRRLPPLYRVEMRACVYLCASLILLNAAGAARALPFHACGILENADGFPPCLVFTSDEGVRVVPQNLAGFQAGDRVVVDGTINTNVAFVCGEQLIPPLEANSIARCVADCGVLADEGSGCQYFESVAGDRFRLEFDSGFPSGSEVFVRGTVDDTLAPCGSQLLPLVSNSIVGPCYRAAGRILNHDGCQQLVTFDGLRLDLQFTSRFDAGDYVEVVGMFTGEDLGPCGNLLLQANTAAPAFGGPGTLVNDPDCGLVFEADAGGFNPRYQLDDTGDFLPGDRVVVTGRLDGVCAGPCSLPCIRENTIGGYFAASGQFTGAQGGCALFQPDDGGPPLLVEYDGSLPPALPVFVTGVVSSDSPLCASPPLLQLRHNTADPYIDICGDLEMGFECAPLLNTASGAFWVERLDVFVLGDRIRVRGALTPPVPGGCPLPTIRYNLAHFCFPGDLNRDGFVTLADVPLFIAVLLGEDTDPVHRAAADTNQDGAADGRDVDLFVRNLFMVCEECS